jgi:hypothetical protein
MQNIVDFFKPGSFSISTYFERKYAGHQVRTRVAQLRLAMLTKRATHSL